MSPALQLAIMAATMAFTIMGAGLSAYVGVRVALAQVQRDIGSLQKDDEKMLRRIDRLEERYFKA